MRTTTVRVIIAAAVLAGGALGISASGQATAPQAQTEKPAFERAADALPRVTWRTRTLVGDERLTNWKLALPADAAGSATFLDGVVRADAAVVNFVEGRSGQPVGAGIQKPLDHNLTPSDAAALRARMGTMGMLVYRPAVFPEDTTARRRVLAFAKALGAETVVVGSGAALAGLDSLADEAGITVAVLAPSARPTALVAALDGKSPRLGVALDTGLLAQEGIAPGEAVRVLKGRVRHLDLRDKSGRGANARDVPIGKGTGNLTELFQALQRENIRLLTMTLHTNGIVSTPADLLAAVAAFEDAVQPAYAANFAVFARTRPIRRDLVTPGRGETLAPAAVDARSAEVLRAIERAIPQQPYAAPKQRRRVLVVESLHGMSHNTIPHTNVMIERLGQISGAWETTLSNDPANLRYPKIKEFDAVFLNSIVGEFLPDPQAREDLARYVREGGGLGGIHGTPWASRNWDEFADIIGAQDAPHRIEQGVMQVYDPSSPLVKMFDGKPLPFREEYYRFRDQGPSRVRWDTVRVLLTVDLDDPVVEPRPWTGYKRPDNIYPVTWIRSYGKGRVFYCSLGHMVETFTTPPLVGHFLAGIQFLTGDLAADATPNPPRGSAPVR